jgi:hypothetical protein
MTDEPNPYALPATTHSYLARAAESLSEAVVATDVPSRYACAHVAALRAAAAAKRAAAEAGSTRAVTEREADDLLRDADRFLGVVEQSLGLAPHLPHSGRLAG